VVQTWPDDPTEAEADPQVIREIVRDAEALGRRTEPSGEQADQWERA
jgi:hypothetical protein